MKKILITCIVIITLAACISPTIKHQIPVPEKPVTLRIDPGGHTSLILDIICHIQSTAFNFCQC